MAGPDDVFAYDECLLRGVGGDGELVGPSPMFEAARLLFNLDRATRLKALESASSQGNEGRALINLDPPSV